MIDFETVTTRAGDDGTSRLYDGTLRPKDDIVFEGMGKIDELTSLLGVVRASATEQDLAGELAAVQSTLGRICAEVATPGDADTWATLEHLAETDVEDLELRQRRLMRGARLGKEFVLPGQTPQSASVDLARAVCRSTERAVVRCSRERGDGSLSTAVCYLNRLSDYLFVLARHVEQNLQEE